MRWQINKGWGIPKLDLEASGTVSQCLQEYLKVSGLEIPLFKHERVHVHKFKPISCYRRTRWTTHVHAVLKTHPFRSHSWPCPSEYGQFPFLWDAQSTSDLTISPALLSTASWSSSSNNLSSSPSSSWRKSGKASKYLEDWLWITDTASTNRYFYYSSRGLDQEYISCGFFTHACHTANTLSF